MVDGVTVIPIKLLPSNCKAIPSPDANATVPCLAKMTPSLRTSGASSAAYPAIAVVMFPSLMTAADDPLRENSVRPAR